jgi:hypothetical protein
MLSLRLNKKLDRISTAANLDEVVFEVIQDAEQKNFVLALVNASRQSNPDNAALVKAAQLFGVSAATPELESQVSRLPYLDINQWRQGLGEVEARVCRVEVPDPQALIMGTGFLVGKRAVITNYHVLKPVIEGGVAPKDVVFRFDYKVTPGGGAPSLGTEFHLVDDPKGWLIDHSPYSPVDRNAEPGPELPGAEQLDYALVRLAGDPADTAVGRTTPAPNQPNRGFVATPMPGQGVALNRDDPLLIVQHPQGWHLKLALETKSVLEVNGNRTRVRHRTNTEKGSSGSPCFDLKWNLLALHHCGNPADNPGGLARWNQAVPFDAVAALIRRRGFGAELA